MVNKPFLLLGLAAKYRSLTVAVINVAADHPLFVTPISAHNVSTVGDSEKSSITTTIKSTRAFQRAIDGVRTLPLSVLKGGSKSDFFRFLSKRQRLIVSSAVKLVRPSVL